MTKQKSTLAILSLFLCVPTILILSAVCGLGSLIVPLGILSITTTSIIQGKLSSNQRNGKNLLGWTLMWLLAQLFFNSVVFYGGCYLVLYGLHYLR